MTRPGANTRPAARACFDTAFHATLPEVARRLPIAAWADAAGVRRYGFHGLSFESVVSRLEGDAVRRCVIAHLGSGASLAAIANGRSIDTTMGMSPTGGIMMGTRTGDLDPGVLVYLMNEKGWGAREVEHFVNHESGLRGVSGTSHDMRSLLDARAHDLWPAWRSTSSSIRRRRRSARWPWRSAA